MNKTRIIFIRHGQVDNPRRILYGRLPRFGLTKSGKVFIKENSSKLKKYGISLIYSSPLLRARQTSQILSNSLKLGSKISKLLLEVKTPYQGIDLTKYKNSIQPYLYDAPSIKEGQESIAEIESRMKKFIHLIKNRHKGQTILAVSHGDPIVILKAAMEGNNFTWNYKKDNYLKTGNWIILSAEADRFVLINEK